MRIPLFVTFLLLAALACLGWRNQQRLGQLRADHEQLATRAASHGIVLDPAAPHGGNRRTKRPRPDRVENVRRAAAGLVAYAADLPALEKMSADEKRRRVLMETERILSLDGAELKILITKLQVATGMDAGTRNYFIRFAIVKLIKNYPQDALAILLETPELDPPDFGHYTPQNLLSSAMREWARLDSHAALACLREHGEGLPETTARNLQNALMDGAATSDPQLALQLYGEFESDSYQLSRFIGTNCGTPGERLAFLAAWREWFAMLPQEEARKYDPDRSFATLVFGGEGERPVSFKDGIESIQRSNITPEELDILTRSNFSQFARPEEVGEWFEWLEKSWPEEYARKCEADLLSGYDTSVAAAEWLMKQPDSPRRREMVGECVSEAFTQNHETGLRLAMSLPEGEQRRDALKAIQAALIWEGDREGAAVFAKEHGIGE